MTYDEYKATKAALEAACNVAAQPLAKLSGGGPMGLTPDAVKFSPEFREVDRAYKLAFAELRAFNGKYVRLFEKEARADRAARYASRASALPASR